MCHLETSESGTRLCPFFYEIELKCKYAEQAVIPGDASVLALYMADRKGEATTDYCERCKTPFTRTILDRFDVNHVPIQYEKTKSETITQIIEIRARNTNE